MPTYQTEVKGVAYSEALAEAAAIAPITRAMLSTFEIRPPVGDIVRIVRDNADLVATLEDDAPENAGEEVTFLKSAVKATRPPESDQAASPTVTLTMDNVAGVLSDALRAARGSLVPWEITERLYASDDLTGPAILPPLTLEITNADVSGTVGSITASFGDSVSKAIPRATFNSTEHPGLSR